MKCTKCGEKWETPAGKSHSFCPSCGSKIAAKTEPATTDSAKAALCYISANFGIDVLLGSKVVSCFADITRGQFPAEKKLIKILAEEGALDCLKEAIGKPETEQAVAVKRAVARLPFAKVEGEEMLFDFASALGWKITKPQPAPQNPQPTQPQQKHTIVLPNINTTNETLSVKPTVGSIHKFADIDWRALAVENNKALLISEKILEKRRFDASSNVWEKSELHNYLNGQFYNSLNAKDKAKVFPSNQGHVFLLSVDEAKKYFKDDQDRIAKDNTNKTSWWWLRSPGIRPYRAAYVHVGGYPYMRGFNVFWEGGVGGGVRPALWLNL